MPSQDDFTSPQSPIAGATDVSRRVRAYLDLAGEDAHQALGSAVADLLDAEREASFRTMALDQWVSRGYLQGRASEELRGRRRDFWLQRLADTSGSHDER